ncbi:hypothetical protein L207DRAFT_581924 [Hyaloscypha variabilis F]|uniref:HORMA domain-containing protein n=1 Tax=Hyaloscypha variabilis (strain UAMH 11265 / GT02V1 / F) TaxID=1149755 RepID=A0A2J6RSK4_HYAVF|nr:hypothetical protein L207DRAFT_581924 [Hyaloscypha variabilis F]
MAGKKKGKKPARCPPLTPLPSQAVRPRELTQLRKDKSEEPQETVQLPTSDVELTDKHSLEIVKTVITATILEIIWVRSEAPASIERIFPDHDWQNYPWDPADPSITYKSFVEGVSGKNKPNYELTDNLILWHFPKRGSSPSLDKVLDCLESGAHDALNQGYLHKLNLSIAHVDDGPITEGNLIESYTIKFFYESGNVTSRIYSETGQKNARISGPVILTDVKNGARKLIDNVAGYLWNNSKRGVLKDHPLPASFRMVMAMDYTDGTPSDYQAPRFHQGDEHASRFINLGYFDENYVLKTGHHSVAVGWHLPGVAPQSLQTTRRIDNGNPSPSEISCHLQDPTTPSMPSRQESIVSELGEGHTHPEAMRQLGGMGAFRQPNTETQDTRPLHRSSPALPRTSTKRRRTEQSQSRPKYPQYTQGILDTLDGQGDVDESGILDCDCGVEDEAKDRLFCLKCKTFHHPQCHGYLDGDHPKYVLCYKCLLIRGDGPNEDELYQEMRDLCVKRRILVCLLETDSPVHIKRINEYSNGDLDRLEKTEIYLAELDLKGFVRIEMDLLKERSSSAFYTLAVDEDTIRSNFFRPEHKISHHFAVPDTPSSARLDEILSADDPNDNLNSPWTARTPSNARSIARAAQRLLAEASSTQDTFSHPSRSRGSTPNLSSSGTQALTPEIYRSSSNKKRTADSNVNGLSPKRRYPATNSPWILKLSDE